MLTLSFLLPQTRTASHSKELARSSDLNSDCGRFLDMSVLVVIADSYLGTSLLEVVAPAVDSLEDQIPVNSLAASGTAVASLALGLESSSLAWDLVHLLNLTQKLHVRRTWCIGCIDICILDGAGGSIVESKSKYWTRLVWGRGWKPWRLHATGAGFTSTLRGRSAWAWRTCSSFYQSVSVHNHLCVWILAVLHPYVFMVAFTSIVGLNLRWLMPIVLDPRMPTKYLTNCSLHLIEGSLLDIEAGYPNTANDTSSPTQIPEPPWHAQCMCQAQCLHPFWCPDFLISANSSCILIWNERWGGCGLVA